MTTPSNIPSDKLYDEARVLLAQRRNEDARLACSKLLHYYPAHARAQCLQNWLGHIANSATPPLPLPAFAPVQSLLNDKLHYSAMLADLGFTFQAQQQFLTSVLYFDLALDLQPGLLSELQDHRFTSAWAALRTAQDTWDWRHYDRLSYLIQLGIAAGSWTVGESILALPSMSNRNLLLATQRHAQQIMGNAARSCLHHQAPVGRIKVGVLGADFYEQATAYLLTGVIEVMDRQRFEITAYDHGQNTGGALRSRAIAAYDHFEHVTSLTDEELAQKIHGDGIDILLSIKNPASARLGALMRKPVAIQIHYLYFPGGSGMPFFDYFLADDVVIPPEEECFYVEKILRMEGCYQPNDALRPLPRQTTRAEFGLPEDAIVLANMSQAYKLTPPAFTLWCQLLHADSNRLLWLLDAGEIARNNLLREAALRGIAPQRIVFSPVMSTLDHLTRLQCADLVLDTWPYGGHTLTSDALWAGTPVVTLCQRTFASRVAASLLQSVGLPNLIAYSEDAYFNLVDGLCRDPVRIQTLKQKLIQGRYDFDLFSAESYAKRLGTALEKAIALRWA